MTWFTVFDSTTGEKISTGQRVASDPDLAQQSFTKITTPFNPQVATKRWNPATRVYDDVTPPTGRLETGAFLRRFTPSEREDVFEAAKNDPNADVRKGVNAFIEFIKISGDVDLDDSYVTTTVNQMESAGILAAGRAAEILG